MLSIPQLSVGPAWLAWYGLAEIGIGLFALSFPSILGILDPLLHTSYGDGTSGARGTYQLLRVLLASGALVLQTALMGATLPLIMKHFVRSRGALGELGAYFYAVNTL